MCVRIWNFTVHCKNRDIWTWLQAGINTWTLTFFLIYKETVPCRYAALLQFPSKNFKKNVLHCQKNRRTSPTFWVWSQTNLSGRRKMIKYVSEVGKFRRNRNSPTKWSPLSFLKTKIYNESCVRIEQRGLAPEFCTLTTTVYHCLQVNIFFAGEKTSDYWRMSTVIPIFSKCLYFKNKKLHFPI